jgi:beta-lactam-binding protein with PASTA domain
VPPSTIAPAVSPALDAVVLRSLAKDRFERFQTAADFRTDVHAAGEGRAPERRRPAAEAESTLFGVDPHSRVGSEAALKELSSDDNDRPQRTQTRPPVAWIWAGIVLVGIVIIAVVFWVVTSTIPQVVGSTYDDAAAQLGDLDLTVTRTDVASDTVEAGRVVSVDPDAGTAVLRNTAVAVTVSSGPVQIAMPSVQGQQLDEAWAAVTAAGLVQGQQTSDYSPDVPENAVLESTPAAGDQVPEGTTVDLVVSNGKVAVPDVTRQSFEQAVAVLSDQLGLTVESYVDPGCSGGTVSNQSLPPGDQPQGSTIELGVCNAG